MFPGCEMFARNKRAFVCLPLRPRPVMMRSIVCAFAAAQVQAIILEVHALVFDGRCAQVTTVVICLEDMLEKEAEDDEDFGAIPTAVFFFSRQ